MSDPLAAAPAVPPVALALVPAEVVPAPPPPRKIPSEAAVQGFEFSGDAREYFRIWIVNTCLTILTLGIFSAWAKVRSKRYFYGNTWLAGAPFDYRADPLAILKGRLISAVALGIYVGSGYLWPMVQLALVGVLFLLSPLVIVTALRFNARNSCYRSLAFRFDGRAMQAASVYVFWSLLIPFSLGLLYPLVKAKQKRFVVDHHRYGGVPLRLLAENGAFYSIYAIGFAMVVALIVTVGLGGGVLAALMQAAQHDKPSPYFMLVYVGLIYLGYFFIFVFIQTRMNNLVWNQIELGGHRFRSNLSVGRVSALYLGNTLAVVLSCGLLIPWAKVRTARYRAQCLILLPGGPIDDFVADSGSAGSATGSEMSDLFDMELGL